MILLVKTTEGRVAVSLKDFKKRDHSTSIFFSLSLLFYINQLLKCVCVLIDFYQILQTGFLSFSIPSFRNRKLELL